MAHDMDLSIIIPCYNEEKNIPLIVMRFLESKRYGLLTELILVNNGSKDNSQEIFSILADQNPDIRIVTIEDNVGYGNGIYQGLLAARGEYVSWTHADLQTDIGDIFSGFSLLQTQEYPKLCFIKGSRYARPILDTLFTLGMSIFESIILQKILSDINAQPNIFHRSLLHLVQQPPLDFSFDLYVYYQMKVNGIKVIKFPVYFGERVYGVSSWNTSISNKYKFIKRTILFTLRLKKYYIR